MSRMWDTKLITRLTNKAPATKPRLTRTVDCHRPQQTTHTLSSAVLLHESKLGLIINQANKRTLAQTTDDHVFPASRPPETNKTEKWKYRLGSYRAHRGIIVVERLTFVLVGNQDFVTRSYFLLLSAATFFCCCGAACACRRRCLPPLSLPLQGCCSNPCLQITVSVHFVAYGVTLAIMDVDALAQLPAFGAGIRSAQ